MARPLTQSDLIFPPQSLNFSDTLHSLKRSALSVTNRLSSITADSEFVAAVGQAYSLPLIANERCGSWYIPPEKKAGGVYFKSTDGHMNQWSFNLRRLNLQLLDLLGGGAEGCVIVDSTRRGKSMPDALSKTVPIWCCVLNRAILPDSGPHELFTPPSAVSASEHAQIERRIDGFVEDFLNICKSNIPGLQKKLRKPLRPLWVTQASTLPSSPPKVDSFHSIVLCTASRRVHGGEVSEAGYIQGAADDQEAWAHGLTPSVFWANHSRIMQANEEDLPELITTLVQQQEGPKAVPVLIAPTSNLYVSSSDGVDIEPFDAIISCTPKPLTTTRVTNVQSKKYIHLPLASGKLGSRDLRAQLSRVPPFIEDVIASAIASQNSATAPKILICDPTGKDLCIGVALAILCLYTGHDGNMSSSRTPASQIHKTLVKQRLTWISISTALNPSRETLKSVNAFLMPDPSARNRDQPTSQEYEASKLVLVDDAGRVITSPAEQWSGENGEDGGDKALEIPTSVPEAHPERQANLTSISAATTNPNSALPPDLTPSKPSPEPNLHLPVTDIPYDYAAPSLSTTTITPRSSVQLSSPPSIQPSHTPPPDSSRPSSAQPSSSLVPSHARSLFIQLRSAPMWRFERRLRSKLPSQPSGTVKGTARFTSYSVDENNLNTLLYSEEGTFVTDSGVEFEVRRRYVYRLEPQHARTGFREERIGVYFSPTQDQAEVQTKDLFVEMGPLTRAGNAYQAQNKERHLCGQDLYNASWKFGTGMMGSEGDQRVREDEDVWWEVTYDVKRPKKDYVSVTRYTRG
ncbi:hypothetical protein M011DRAFT_484126 [Sporormia fimetaria CBS 119925]|uniref:Initiator tRNA phosphoribosyl transferase n=1 Tax=Sporormia fimetaria CBS 119925 TaxID=1340428 RepID=A0A6A6VM98_9PLEO|nr:hypothetical protein M011DRAFT_484126 [Sporormia fimetaria CBS 119925]